MSKAVYCLHSTNFRTLRDPDAALRIRLFLYICKTYFTPPHLATTPYPTQKHCGTSYGPSASHTCCCGKNKRMAEGSCATTEPIAEHSGPACTYHKWTREPCMQCAEPPGLRGCQTIPSFPAPGVHRLCRSLLCVYLGRKR